MLWSVVLIALCFSCNEMEEQRTARQIIEEWKPIYLRYDLAQTEHNRIKYCYKDEGEEKGLPSNRTYPEYYGGMYVDTINPDKIVINLTDTSEEVKEHFIQLCRLSPENYIFRRCDWSLNELHQLMNQLIDVPNFFRVWDVEYLKVLEEENMLNVCFWGMYDEGKISRFKSEVCNSPKLRFTFAGKIEKSSPQIESTTELDADYLDAYYELNVLGDSVRYLLLKGGSSFFTGGKQWGKVGFTAYLRDGNSWIQGFVTAAHIFKSPNENIYAYVKSGEDKETVKIGECVKLSEVVDVAFCKIESYCRPGGYHVERACGMRKNQEISFWKNGIGIPGMIRAVDMTFDTDDGRVVYCHKGEIYGNTYQIKRGDSGALITENSKAAGVAIGIPPYSDGHTFYAVDADFARSVLGVVMSPNY